MADWVCEVGGGGRGMGLGLRSGGRGVSRREGGRGIRVLGCGHRDEWGFSWLVGSWE